MVLEKLPKKREREGPEIVSDYLVDGEEDEGLF